MHPLPRQKTYSEDWNNISLGVPFLFFHCLVPSPSVIVAKLNATAVTVAISLSGGNFDNGNLTLDPTVADSTFSQSDFPLTVEGLTAGTDYNLTFVFSVGDGSTDCGVNGVVNSEPVIVSYEPGINDDHIALEFKFRFLLLNYLPVSTTNLPNYLPPKNVSLGGNRDL